MKKLIMFIGIAVLIAGCSDDDKDNTTDNSHLISPRMAMSIDNINGQQSSFTGILTVIPCDANRFHLLWKLCKRKAVSFLRLLPSKGRYFL